MSVPSSAPAGSIVVGGALMTPEVQAMMPSREADHAMDPCRCSVCTMATNVMQGALDCQEMMLEDDAETPTTEQLDALPWADLMHLTLCQRCSAHWRKNDAVAARLAELRLCLKAGVNFHNREIMEAVAAQAQQA